MSIDNIVDLAKDRWLETTARLSENPVYKYCVDVVSGWVYYTPTYALQELISKYAVHGAVTEHDMDTIKSTRLIGLATHAAAMRYIGKRRDHFAKKYNVTKDSPLKDKMKVNLVAVTPVQAVVYAGMIIGGMAKTNNWDWESAAYMWTIGVVVGAAHSFFYGPVNDRIRKYCGVRPAIAKKEVQSTYVN